jgi:hypothetical protein
VRLLTVPVLREGRRVEIIQVSAPLARLRDALSGYLTTLLALVPVAVALAVVGGFVVTGRALLPCGTCPGPRVRSPPKTGAAAGPARGRG